MDIVLNLIGKNNLSGSEIELIRTTILLLVSLPVIATITGILRHIVGIKNLGVYAPIILTFAFYQLGTLTLIDKDTNSIVFEQNFLRGLIFGLIIFSVVLTFSIIMFRLLKGLRMHFVPKTTLVLLVTSISILVMIILSSRIFEKKGFIYLDIFSIIMIATLSDMFFNDLSRKTVKMTIKISLQTLIASVSCYALIRLAIVENLILNYTIFVFAAIIIINLYVGHFMGLRISEYFRFRELIFTKPRNKK